MDAGTLSHLPLNIDNYVIERTEELSRKVIQATWNGARAARESDVAWVAALALAADANIELQSSISTDLHTLEELAKAQRMTKQWVR